MTEHEQPWLVSCQDDGHEFAYGPFTADEAVACVEMIRASAPGLSTYRLQFEQWKPDEWKPLDPDSPWGKASEASSFTAPDPLCTTCNGTGTVEQEGILGTPGVGGHYTCPDCLPRPSKPVEVDRC